MWQMSIATPQAAAGLVGVGIDYANRQHLGLGYTLAFLFSSCAFLAGTVMVKKVRGST